MSKPVKCGTCDEDCEWVCGLCERKQCDDCRSGCCCESCETHICCLGECDAFLIDYGRKGLTYCLNCLKVKPPPKTEEDDDDVCEECGDDCEGTGRITECDQALLLCHTCFEAAEKEESVA